MNLFFIPQGIITDIIYRGTDEQIRTCLLPSVLGNDRESASLVSGIVFFSFQVCILCCTGLQSLEKNL